MIKRKGITPLIATVLLIGFTVALAAVIMTWGLDYVKKTQEGVGESTEQQLKCASQLDFQIAKVDCTGGSSGKGSVTIDNTGTINISSMLIRVDKGEGKSTPTSVGGLPPFGIDTFDVDLSGATKVEAVASILTSSGNEIPCNTNVKEYDLSAPC